jgi:hypothetical protein
VADPTADTAARARGQVLKSTFPYRTIASPGSLPTP